MSDTNLLSADISIRDMKIFLSVSSTGSFRATAHNLYTSQPAVSRAIARLEEHLHAQLMIRGPRGAVLTEAGELAVTFCRGVIRNFNNLQTSLTDGTAETIRLGAAPTAAGVFLAPFLSQWVNAFPKVNIEVIEQGSSRLRVLLAEDRCDVALTALPISDDFDSEQLEEIRVCAFFPDKHPLADVKSPLTLSELVKYPIVTNSEGFLASQLLLQACESEGLHPRIVYRSNVGQTLAALAEASVGIAVFAESVDLRGFTLCSRAILGPSDELLKFRLGIAWKRRTGKAWVNRFGLALAESIRVQGKTLLPDRNHE